MISGNLGFSAKDSIIPAQAEYIEIAQAETDENYIWLVVERSARLPSLAEKFWGQTLAPSQFEAIKKNILEWPLQSLVIEKSKVTRHIAISRNHHATCPLYLLAAKGTLYCHWDPVELYAHIQGPHPLDIEAAVAFLKMTRDYSPETPFKDILLLPERGCATFDGASLKIIRPPHIDPSIAVALKENTDPVAVFLNMAGDVVAHLPLEDNNACAELSSGLDTTLVANLLHNRISPQRLSTFGYCMLDKQREDIRSMRMESVSLLNIDDHYEPIENNFSAAFSLHQGKYWPYQTQTAFEKLRFAKRAASLGKTSVLTGIGGDELCMLTAAERAESHIAPQPSCYRADSEQHISILGNSAGKDQKEYSWPNGYIADSAPDMANSCDFLYLRHGIWPFHPLALAELHGFTRFLPREWRYKRRLSREALLRLGYSAHFVKQDPKERLSDTMIALMLGAKWDIIFKNAALFDFGLVDRARFMQAVDLFRKKPSDSIGIDLMTALALELSVQSLNGFDLLAKTA